MKVVPGNITDSATLTAVLYSFRGRQAVVCVVCSVHHETRFAASLLYIDSSLFDVRLTMVVTFVNFKSLMYGLLDEQSFV